MTHNPEVMEAQYATFVEEIEELLTDFKTTENMVDLMSAGVEDENQTRLYKARYSQLGGLLNALTQRHTETKCLGRQLKKGKEELKKLDELKAQAKETYYKILAFEGSVVEESNRSLHSSTSLPNYSHPSFQAPAVSIKLPQIPLITFNGDLAMWATFRDTYLALVHDNPTLTEMDKYHYLKAHLKGSALLSIGTIPFTANDYKQAWEALKRKFENKRLQAGNYLNKVFSYKPVQRNNLAAIQHLYETVFESIKAFKNLKLQDEGGFILMSFVLRLLSPQLRDKFESSRQKFESIPTLLELEDFIYRQMVLLQTEACTTELFESKPQNSKTNVMQAYEDQKSKLKCMMCDAEHPLYTCPTFIQLPPADRLKRFYEFKPKSPCLNCLSPYHQMKHCKSESKCQHCSRSHHTLLHQRGVCSQVEGKETDGNLLRKGDKTNEQSILSTITKDTPIALLGTANARIKGHRGYLHPLRLVVDCGAQRSFVTQELAERLKLKQTANPHALCGFGGTSISGGRLQARCTIIPSNSESPELTTDAVVVPKICATMPNREIDASLIDVNRFDLADNEFWKPGEIDFLLGSDLFVKILDEVKQRRTEDPPYILHTIFGSIIMGPIQGIISSDSTTLLAPMEDSLCSLMDRFWRVEEITTNTLTQNPDDKECEEHFIRNHSRNEEGRYVVRLPFRSNVKTQLGLSLPMALHRFYRLENKFAKEPKLQSEYNKVIEEHLKLGYISPTSEWGEYYLPHHGIFKAQSTTKLRIVFDASAATSSGSLNDRLHSGPKLQLEIKDVLLGFRTHRIALTSDITHMFLQIEIHPKDRKFQHFFYRFSKDAAVEEYRFNRLSFGMSCSPYLAIRVIRQLVEDEGNVYPNASRALLEEIYVDDILTGAENYEEAVRLKNEVTLLLRKGKFELKGWNSNVPELVQGKDDANKIYFGNLEDATSKVLGMQWDTMHDSLSYKVHEQNPPATKRGIMSTIARTYDPLGYLAPVVFKAKTIMQRLWRGNLDWDETIPPEIKEEWSSFYRELKRVEEVSIPRCFLPSKMAVVDIVGFADASSDGYAAVVYLRVENTNDRTSGYLVVAKTKLAPLKAVTIPRLELCAALLLTKLINSNASLWKRLNVRKTVLMSDSKTVLSWLKTPTYKLKTFVANRVQTITDAFPPEWWFHVPTLHNAADIASRGTTAAELLRCRNWWQGPDWMADSFDKWPISKLEEPISFTLPETKEIILFNAATNDILPALIEKFSTLARLINVFAYARRAIHNFKAKKNSRNTKPLSLIETRSALFAMIKFIQDKHFGSEPVKLKELKSLSPFHDSQEILRIGGRLQNSPLPFESRHPIILPSKERLTTLIVEHYHRLHLHAGPTLLRALLLRKYWILNGRNLIRRVVHQCQRCHRHKVQTFSNIMANLPKSRFMSGRAFLNVGVDYAGPLTTKESHRRRAVTHKTYIAVFVCMSTKAIHLEVVSNLTTDNFLAALDRFVARRGVPVKIFSDNGLNFVGAQRSLKELYEWLRKEDTQTSIQNNLRTKEIEWEFIPPSAPHFGGLWEAGVKSMKFHLTRVVGNQTLTYEELDTVTCKIEAMLNSRPLYEMSADPDCLDVLTPGHFLVGGPLAAVPEADLAKTPDNRLVRWQMVQKSTQDVWKRWRSDYFNALQQKSKWTDVKPNVEPETLVLLKDPTSPPLHWPVGRVLETFPGPDGIVRVVKIRTAKGDYVRPLVKLAPLLPDERLQ